MDVAEATRQAAHLREKTKLIIISANDFMNVMKS